MKLYRYLIFCLLLISLGACDDKKEENRKEDYRLDIVNIEFEPDYKRFYADARLGTGLSALLLQGDTTLHVQISESVGNDYDARTQPKLIGMTNMVTERFKKMNLNVLGLADLTLSPEMVEQQRKAMIGIKNLFSINHFNVAFIQDKTVSETMIGSDYVLNNYFKPVKGDKYLYRSVLEKVMDYSTPRTENAGPKANVIVVFSDGKVYDENNLPIDPEHFAMEHHLLEHIDSLTSPLLYYVNLNEVQEDEWHEAPESENILSLLCRKTGGAYLDGYNEHDILENILGTVNRDAADFRYYFENPDLKVYPGNKHTLSISYSRADSLLAADFIDYYVGSVYHPVIINGPTLLQVVMQGILLALAIILLIYVLLQLIVPFFSYLWFRHKYVTRYSGKNMSFNGFPVNEVCYYCKAPFEEGEEIVVKCKHAVHRTCWDENDYKCPEYGRNCKHGSHYYNRHRLLDPHNASFHMKWILTGAFAGLIAWLCFSLFSGDGNSSVLTKIIPFIYGVDPQSPQAVGLINDYGSHLFFLPFYGLNICFFLTLGLSVLVEHGRWMGRRILFVVGKGLVGGLVGFVAFFLGSIISILLNFKDNSFLIDWIPWLLSGLAMTFIVAYGTDVKLKKALFGALLSIVFGLGSMYIWTFSSTSQIDTRDLILLSYLLFSMGFAFSIAMTYPRSERYFLRVEGPVKATDIALYKWMNSMFLQRQVKIGKSVNCELQMTWDIMADIAPVQAMVIQHRGNIYLIPAEDGVLMRKKHLKVDVPVRLYHGTQFTIGNTLFTYLEKDV